MGGELTATLSDATSVTKHDQRGMKSNEMKKVNFWFRSIAGVTWLFGALAFDSYAFDAGRRSLAGSPHQYTNAGVIIFDNDFLDRYFSRDRALERERLQTEKEAAPKPPRRSDFPTLSPKRSLLAGISQGTSPRRAAALRFGEKGRILMQNREYQKAVSYFERALSLDATPVFHFYLAQAHYHLGDNQRSLNFLEVAEFHLQQQPEWIDEVTALRIAASTRQVAQPAIPKQNVGFFVADY